MHFLFSKEPKCCFTPAVWINSPFRGKASMGVCCWGIPTVEFWSLLAPRHTPPHCFKAVSNFVGFVIKQHWRLWFLMPSLESMSEVKGHFPCGKGFHMLLELNKNEDSIPVLWLCTIYHVHTRDAGEMILIADGEKSSVTEQWLQTQIIWLKSQASPDRSGLITKPTSPGWGLPVCHLLRWLWSGCVAMRTLNVQHPRCK